MLLKKFLKPMGITQYRLAKEIGVSLRQIGEIITDTNIRLCRFSDSPAVGGCACRPTTTRKSKASLTKTPFLRRVWRGEHIHDEADEDFLVLGIRLGNEQGERGQADIVDHGLVVTKQATVAIEKIDE